MWVCFELVLSILSSELFLSLVHVPFMAVTVWSVIQGLPAFSYANFALGPYRGVFLEGAGIHLANFGEDKFIIVITSRGLAEQQHA